MDRRSGTSKKARSHARAFLLPGSFRKQLWLHRAIEIEDFRYGVSGRLAVLLLRPGLQCDQSPDALFFLIDQVNGGPPLSFRLGVAAVFLGQDAIQRHHPCFTGPRPHAS